jgi:2,3-bisphosphoglycerate-dependent phosphoglycerate mutase
MITQIYFIRHAEPDRKKPSEDTLRENKHPAFVDSTCPLTDKGLADRALVTHFLRDKNINVILSSPFKRSYDTVAHFAAQAGLEIEIVEDFRERRTTHEHIWIEDFKTYSEKQWADFSYKLEDGESLAEVQARNVAALSDVLKRYAGKNIAVGTHGTALSTIINFYDPTYGIADFWDMAGRMPWAVRMAFDGENCVGIEKVDLFNQLPFVPENADNFNNNAIGNIDVITQIYPYNTFSEYKYTVIFARRALGAQWQWLYARHKERATYECPGGRVEPGETPLECAKRELREETGAENFHIYPAFDYTVHRNGTYSIGQAFLADVDDLGLPDLTHEMVEVRAFATLPEAMTYPGILPVLFEAMREWMAKNTPEEYWDLLDADRNPLGIVHKRGDPLPPGAFHAVVCAWVMNAKGQFISTRRCLTKLGSPGLWEITSGSVNAGETSREAAAREVREETGVILPPECVEAAELFLTQREEGSCRDFWDNWLFRHDFDLSDFVPQKGETMDAKAVTPEEITYMVEKGEFVGFVCEKLDILKTKIF